LDRRRALTSGAPALLLALLLPWTARAQAPTATALTPTTGPLGTTLTVDGTNLTGLTGVRLGGVPARFTPVSTTRFTAVVPRGAVNQKVSATTPSGTALTAATFQIRRPSDNTAFPNLGLLTTNGTTPVQGGGFAKTAVADLDGDGLLDLLVGNDAGTVNRFEQTTANGTAFAALGSLGLSSSESFAAPTVTDVDGDGLLDLLVGNGGGTVTRFEQTAANAATFARLGNLTTNGTTALNVGNHATPTVTDVDGDGLLDLILGSQRDGVQRFEQTVANGAAFAAVGLLTTDGTTALPVGSFAAPVIADVDGDGLLDLLVQGQTNDSVVQRFEQTAANAGTFALAGVLTADGSNPLVYLASAPAVTDVDGDGLLDLLFGEFDGTVTRYEQYPPFAPLTLTSLSPASGPLGTTLTVDGTNLTGVTSVRLGGVPARFTPVSATRFTAVVPREAVDQKVRVTAPGTTALTARTFQITRPSNSAAFLRLGPLTTNGTTVLNVGNVAAAATVTDVDGDGLLDLLVGSNAGYSSVLRYEQTAANSPVFAALGDLNLYRPDTSPTPTVTDVDGDGLLDLLVGGDDGYIRRYEQTAANGTTFNPTTELTTDGTNLIIVGNGSAPTVTDLDSDGLLDLLVGNQAGTVTRFEQTNPIGAVFALVGPLTTNGTTVLSAGSYATPTVTDADGDGLLDLLVGNAAGAVTRFEQTAANGGVFAPLGSLSTGGGTALSAGTRAAPVVTDVDGDGLLDLLVGDGTGNVTRFEQALSPTLTSLSPAAGPLGSTLTVDGTNLTGLTSVRLGGVPARFTPVSATRFTAVVPRGAVNQKVSATTPGGTALTASAFQVTRPSNNTAFPGLGNLTTDGTTTLSTDRFAAPTLTDLDGDGLLDLLVGSVYGRVNRFEQTAANAGTFAALGDLGLDAGDVVSPTVTDLDGDGLLDLLVGNSNGGNVQCYEQTAANSGSFADLGSLTANGITINVGSGPKPTVTDLDGDGLLDLLVGNADGIVAHYEQTVANGSSFTSLGPLTTNGTAALNVGNGAGPIVTDLDSDGLLDLLVGNADGIVARFEQTVANGTSFARLGVLTADGTTTLRVGEESAPTLTDVDGDGLLDLLVGNPDGSVTRYEQALPPPVPTLTSLSPTSGPVSTSVTLTGTNFTGATGVRFNGTLTAVTVTSATTATASVPAGATTGSVTLTTPGGPSNGLLFTVTAAPSVTTAAPAAIGSGSARLGGSVTAEGGSAVTERGVVYVVGAGTPTISNTKVVMGNGPGAFDQVVTGLTASTGYTVRAYATNSVDTSYGSAQTFTTAAPLGGTLAVTNVVCFGGSTGALDLTPHGGLPPYTFAWADGPTTEDRAGLPAGTYSVVITDAAGATAPVSATVSQPAALSLAGSQTNVSVSGGRDGSATVAPTGGTPGYTYDWAPGTPAGDGTATITGLAAGTYTVTVTNANNCSATRSFTLTQPATGTPVVTTPADGSLTNNPTPTYGGTGPAGSTITVLVDGTSIGTTPATAGGTFSLVQPTALADGAHTVRATATAGTTTSGLSNANTFTVDATAPTARLTSSAPNPTSTAPIPVTVTFTEAVTGFSAAGVRVGNGTVGNFAGSGATYTFDVTPAATGPVTVSLAANAARDAAGNGNPATASFSIAYVSPDLLISTGTAGSPVPVAAGTYRNITVTGTGYAQLGGAVTVTGTVRVQGGLLTNCQPLTGGAGTSFVLAAGATLGICDEDGIAASGATGAVQTATRSFSLDAIYLYNGSVMQVTGPGLPGTVRELALSNAFGLTLSQPVQLTQRVLLNSGDLDLAGYALALLSTANGTALVANLGGRVLGATATLQRHIETNTTAGGYRHYASPMQATAGAETLATLATAGYAPDFSGAAAYNSSATPGLVTPFPSVYLYNQDRIAGLTSTYGPFDKGWQAALGTEVPQVGRGYAVQAPGAALVDFTGTLTTGSVSRANLRRASTDPATGWHLLGNPFPSPLDWSTMTVGTAVTDNLQNVDEALYVFESSGPYTGSYRTYLASAPGTVSPIIPAGTGFFVHITAPTTPGTVRFTPNNRVTTFGAQPAFGRGAADARPRLALELRGAAGTRDVLTVYADPAATAGLDPAFDALKLPNPSGLNLAAQAGPHALAINGLPAFAPGTVVPLSVGVPSAGPYALAVPDLQNLPVGGAVLVDTQLNTRTDLAALPATGYAFTVTAAQATVLLTGRFYLNLGAAGPLATAPGRAGTALQLYPNPTHGAATLTGAQPEASVTVYDALGRAVLSATANAAGTATLALPAGLPTGVYVVRTGSRALRLTVE
jgi:uncharacterized protein (DUF2141 family)